MLKFFNLANEQRHCCREGFGEAVEGLSPAAQSAFFADNFIDLMGEGLEPALRRPALR